MKTVLVIDNSKLMRTVVKGMMEEQGMKAVGEAADIQEGIQAYEQLKPDLVTLDLVMPGGSGVDVLKTIISKNPSAKVVIITETGQDTVEKQLMTMGARAVLRKPITTEAVKETLSRLRDEGAGAAAAAAPAVQAKKRVLVVDDSMVMRAMIKAILEEQGMEIIGEAGDVPEGIKAFESLKPDLMTLDLIMPGGSGLDVLKALMPKFPDARIIVVTAVNQSTVEQDALKLGAKAIINKPLTDEVVKSALEKALGPAPAAAGAAANGVVITEQQAKALHELFASGADKCIQAMNTMCKADWKTSDLKLGDGTGKECADMVGDLKIGESISIQMTVAKDIPMVALLLASQDGAQNIARLLTRNNPERVDKEVVKLVWMEWSNILITTVLNVFANAMGSAILSSTPEYLEGPTDRLVLKSCGELTDNPQEHVFIAQTSFNCSELKADCRTLFLLRMDSLSKLTPEKV